MSIARIYTTQESCNVWTCGSCGEVLPVGSKVLGFAVGFRGHTRCSKPECFPTLSQRLSANEKG